MSLWRGVLLWRMPPQVRKIHRILRFLTVLSIAALLSTFFTGIAMAAVPTVPANLTATASNKSVILSWTASSNVPTDYVIEYSSDGFVDVTNTFFDGISTTTTATVTGLTNGQLYTFRVKGTNGSGTSAASATATAIPYKPAKLFVYRIPDTIINAGNAVASRETANP